MHSARKYAAYLNAILFYLLISFLPGCIKDNDFDFDKVASVNWNPDIAVPLIHSTFTMSDLVNDETNSVVTIDSNNLVTLVYKGNIYSMKGSDFLPVINQSDIQTVTLNTADSTTLYAGGTCSKVINSNYPFAFPNGELLDSLTLGSGTMFVNIQNNIPHPGTLHISIPTATLNGISFSKDVIFPAGGGTVQVLDSADLTGYDVNLVSTGVQNTLPMIYTVIFQNSSSAQSLTSRFFTFTNNFSNMVISRAFGYFGQRPLNITVDSSEITLFTNSAGGTLSFHEPKVTFQISNSFGMPVDAHLTSFYAIPASGTNIPVTGSIPDPVPVGTPLFPGDIARTSFSLDKNNSNIQSVLSQQPHFLGYSVNATSNTPPVAQNFLLDTSELRIDLQMNLPMWGSGSGFTVADTADFSLEKIDEIETAVFRLNATNGFPARAFIQVYFTDSNYVVLDSMISQPSDFIIESGAITPNGVVIHPTHKMKDEPFDQNRLQHIYNASKLIIRSVIETQGAPAQEVFVFAGDQLDVQVGVRAKLKIKVH